MSLCCNSAVVDRVTTQTKICAIMDKKLIPSPGTDESKVFYYKMKGDYYRYLAEFATGKAKSKAREDACVAYAGATTIEEKT